MTNSHQIRTLSDLQGAAALQAADPSLQVNLKNHIWWNLPFLQAAYIAKLHQQAASIKNLLKLLNAGETGLTIPGDLTASANVGSFENVSESSNNNNVNLNFAQSGPEESVYESLWETGSLFKPRVNEVEEPREEEGRASQAEGEVRTFRSSDMSQ